MNLTDLYATEIKRLDQIVDDPQIHTPDDARNFLIALTKLIYDYKMIGRIYDFYTPDVAYYKQNKVVFHNVEDVVRQVAAFSAAFPNLRTQIEHVIVYQVNDDFYKLSKRLRYWGNNYGAGPYGPPTGKSLENNCLSMSMLYLQRIDGQWKIPFEINNDSELWLKDVQSSQSSNASSGEVHVLAEDTEAP